jgi:hypothetical protein
MKLWASKSTGPMEEASDGSFAGNTGKAAEDDDDDEDD